MGLGGGEKGADAMDVMDADALRVELEENRQYLVRALRAVELTTAECKEEARLAALKADAMQSQVQHLQDTVAERDESIVRLQAESAASIDALHQEVREQGKKMDDADDAIWSTATMRITMRCAPAHGSAERGRRRAESRRCLAKEVILAVTAWQLAWQYCTRYELTKTP